MADVFLVADDGSSQPLAKVRCVNEDRELQLILERNHDLLPGDQIDPEEPRRWLLIKREMAVPDPSTGSDRWSIDFFFVDQDAIPTLVECKRFDDTRARREVVGQMLEYAANGPHYWDKQTLRGHAEQTASARGLGLEAALQELSPTIDDSVDAFFDRVQENLREGQLRIVFFLEESSMELRSIVDFLNKQMERSEILLVEARQYTANGLKIVVPRLFGYTEEARIVKRSVSVTTARSRRQWDDTSFFAELRKHVSEAQVQQIYAFYEESRRLGCEIVWGTGTSKGSFTVKHPEISSRGPFYVTSNGELYLNFGHFNSSETITIRDRLKALVTEKTGLTIRTGFETKYPSYPAATWLPFAEGLLQGVIQLLEDARGGRLHDCTEQPNK